MQTTAEHNEPDVPEARELDPGDASQFHFEPRRRSVPELDSQAGKLHGMYVANRDRLMEVESLIVGKKQRYLLGGFASVGAASASAIATCFHVFRPNGPSNTGMWMVAATALFCGCAAFFKTYTWDIESSRVKRLQHENLVQETMRIRECLNRRTGRDATATMNAIEYEFHLIRRDINSMRWRM